MKFSRFASLLFLFCCSHVFILVFVFNDDDDFWIRFLTFNFSCGWKGIENEAAAIREDVNMDMSSSLELGTKLERKFTQRTEDDYRACFERYHSLTPLSCNTCFYQLISGPTCSSDRMKNWFSNQTEELHSFHKSQSYSCKKSARRRRNGEE